MNVILRTNRLLDAPWCVTFKVGQIMSTGFETDPRSFQQPESYHLAFCPECSYPLTGLPERHRCPECGRPFDQIGYCVASDVRGIYYFWIFASFIVAWPFVRDWRSAFGNWFLIVCAASLLLSVVAFVIRNWRHGNPKEYLLLDRTHLFWRVRGAPEFSRLWTEIESVRWEPDRKAIVIKLRNDCGNVDLPSVFGAAGRASEKTLNIVRAFHSRYGTQST